MGTRKCVQNEQKRVGTRKCVQNEQKRVGTRKCVQNEQKRVGTRTCVEMSKRWGWVWYSKNIVPLGVNLVQLG